MNATLAPTALLGPATQGKIVEYYRAKIVSGGLTPGQKLPTRDEMTAHFATTRDTVQRAFDVLIDQGFIETQGRRGTFVATNPPHLARYALIFPDEPDDELQWSRFWTSLCRQAMVLEAERSCKLPFFYAVAQDKESRGYKQLFEEAATHQLSGLIFASSPHFVPELPRLMDTGLPMVGIMSSSESEQIPCVTIDSRSFFTKAIGHLASRGRRRLAVFDIVGAVRNISRVEVAHEIQRHGMETRPYWWQTVHCRGAEAAREVAHLLANPAQRERPDAYIILDDHLEAPALAGLRDAGLQIGGDVDVVAHCNFPAQLPTAPGVTRLGYSGARVLEACLNSVNARRDGTRCAHQTTIEADFAAPSLSRE